MKTTKKSKFDRFFKISDYTVLTLFGVFMSLALLF